MSLLLWRRLSLQCFPILARLELSADEWLQEACEFEARYAQN